MLQVQTNVTVVLCSAQFKLRAQPGVRPRPLPQTPGVCRKRLTTRKLARRSSQTGLDSQPASRRGVSTAGMALPRMQHRKVCRVEWWMEASAYICTLRYMYCTQHSLCLPLLPRQAGSRVPVQVLPDTRSISQMLASAGSLHS